MPDRETIFRNAFIAIRNLSSHAPVCTMCIGMFSGGDPCPVFTEATAKCREANELLKAMGES
jgi:hypothetical protein